MWAYIGIKRCRSIPPAPVSGLSESGFQPGEGATFTYNNTYVQSPVKKQTICSSAEYVTYCKSRTQTQSLLVHWNLWVFVCLVSEMENISYSIWK